MDSNVSKRTAQQAGSLSLRADGALLQCSAIASYLLGSPVVGHFLQDLASPGDSEHLGEELRAHFALGTEQEPMTLSFRLRTGEARHVICLGVREASCVGVVMPGQAVNEKGEELPLNSGRLIDVLTVVGAHASAILEQSGHNAELRQDAVAIWDAVKVGADMVRSLSKPSGA